MRLFKTAATAVLCLSLTAIAAEASYPPLKYTRTRADLAAACTALGPRGQGYGFDQPTGPYGCRDMETGNAVTCKANGSCTDYSGDPRWKKLHDWLNGKAETPRPGSCSPISGIESAVYARDGLSRTSIDLYSGPPRTCKAPCRARS